MPPIDFRTAAERSVTSRRAAISPMTSMAAAIAIALGGLCGEASALSLGRINVLSTLGEPLRAEVDIAEITAAEAQGLRVGVASSDAFRLAGINYNAALSEVQSSLQQRADGRYFVRLTSSRGITDPFVDLLLEANTSSSRVLRDYTLLLDPPVNRAPPVAAATVAESGSSGTEVSAATAAEPAPPPALPLPAVVTTTPQTPSDSPARRLPSSATPSAPAQAAADSFEPRLARAGRSDGTNRRATVRPGDTASGLASVYKPAEISLDQMLVAMLRANPDAFIGGNVNRMRAGALIELPDAAQAASTPAPEARRIVVAQSRDFAGYRRSLADNAPTSRVAEAGREASGTLQASVEDRSTSAASPDKLTVAQGRLADQQLVQSRQAQESSARMAELSKNIGDLNRLQGADAEPMVASDPAAPLNADSAPAKTGDTSAVPLAATSPASTSEPGLTALEAATSVSAASTPAKQDATPEAGAWYAGILDNPVILGALSLAVLLLGWGAYRMAGKRKQEAVDSAFSESRLPKDSFFAGSGGESVDTNIQVSPGVSSLSYSPSQLDAGDVDPVAEADVYLAYGRDLQAEEILREALRVNPDRIAIHLKLLEIHAKRRDLRAYEALAADVQQLTNGIGNEWNRVVEMGRELDPGNPLYEAGMRSPTFLQEPSVSSGVPVTATAAVAATAGAASFSHTLDAVTQATPAPAPPAFLPTVAPLDFDLDLDRPDAQAALESEWITATLAPRTPAVSAPSDTSTSDTSLLPLLDLGNDFRTEPGALGPRETRSGSSGVEDQATVRGDLMRDSGFLEFDLSAFDGLRTADSTQTEAGSLDLLEGATNDTEDPHFIKLSLARELQALGDTEGARSLVEEVEAESTGDMKAQAQALLATLA